MNEASTILVVDDGGRPLGNGIRQKLEAEGYRVEVAPDGEAGLERIRGGDVALIVRDAEMLLRVAAILGRSTESGAATEVLTFGGNWIDLGTDEAQAWDGSQHLLAHRDAMVLRVLADRAGSVVGREEILDHVWGHQVLPSTRTIDTIVARLRQCFERCPDHPVHFQTVPGVGYRFTPEPNAVEQ